MADRIAAPVHTTAEQASELIAMIRAHSTPQKLAERARIIMLASEGINVSETARQLGTWRKTVHRWRKRWLEADATASFCSGRLASARLRPT